MFNVSSGIAPLVLIIFVAVFVVIVYSFAGAGRDRRRGAGRMGPARPARQGGRRLQRFGYRAMNAQGEAIEDEVDTFSDEEAVQQVRFLGHFPTDIRPIEGGPEYLTSGEGSAGLASAAYWECPMENCRAPNPPHGRFCRMCGRPRA